MAKAQQTPKVTTTHDYISINFGNGRRLTTSWGGQKATGKIPQKVWNTFIHYTTGKHETDALRWVNMGERIHDFVTNINTIWPEWNVAPPTFKVGQRVKYEFSKRDGGMDYGTVSKVNTTTYTIAFDRLGSVKMSGDLLAQHNAAA